MFESFSDQARLTDCRFFQALAHGGAQGGGVQRLKPLKQRLFHGQILGHGLDHQGGGGEAFQILDHCQTRQNRRRL